MIFAGAINIALAIEAVAPWTCQIWHDRKQLAQVLAVWWWVWVCTLWCKSIIFEFYFKKRDLQICNSTPARWQTQPQSAPMRPMPEGRWSCLLEPQSCLLAAPTPPERHRYGGRAVIFGLVSKFDSYVDSKGNLVKKSKSHRQYPVTETESFPGRMAGRHASAWRSSH